MRRYPVMLRQNPTDPLRSRRMFRGEVAAAPGHDGVHVGLVRVAVCRVHVVVVIVVVIIVVIVVVLERKSTLRYTQSAIVLLCENQNLPDYC